MLDDFEIQRIIRYMIHMYRYDNIGLTIGSTTGVRLFVTCDTSFACHKDMKSHTGGTIHLGPEFGSFSSLSEKIKLQPDSSAAAEGLGCHINVRKALPIRYYLEELWHIQNEPTRVAMDNVPFMQAILGEKGYSKFLKHVLIRVRVANDALENKEITLEHLDTEDMPADTLTKALTNAPFHRHRRVLLGADPVKIAAEYIRDPALHSH